MFQDGRYLLVLPASLVIKTADLSQKGTKRECYNTPLPKGGRLHSFPPFHPLLTHAGPVKKWSTRHKGRRHLNTTSDQIPFPFNNFTYYFTLFSKFFSSFHHCTCLLSVSRYYLALDGIYHPLRAAIPNNSTRRKTNWITASQLTGLSPSTAAYSKALNWHNYPNSLPPNYNSGLRQISNLGCCRFVRHYWGNPCWFLFLRLLICLSSAGPPTWFEVKIW